MLQLFRKVVYDFRTNILLLGVFVVFAFLSFFLMRDYILRNFRQLGDEIAASYAIDEEKNIISYERFIVRGAAIVEQSKKIADREKWLSNMFEALALTSTDDKNINPFAVVDGKVVTAGKEYNTRDFTEYWRSEWYQKAVKAKDKIILTDVYIDPHTQKPAVAMAKQTKNPGEVIAIVISADNCTKRVIRKSAQFENEYYLFDSKGHYFYCSDGTSVISEKDKKYAAYLSKEVMALDPRSKVNFVEGPDGGRKLLFFSRTKDGWYCVITISHDFLLKDLYELLAICLCVTLLFLLILLVVVYKKFREHQLIEEITETVEFLGNIYYAIFLVDLEEKKVTSIKVPDDYESSFEPNMEYDEFYEKVAEKVQKDVLEEFRSSFSYDNMKKLFSEGIKEFGGEYRRNFTGNDEWVSARVFFDNNLSSHKAIICFKKITEEKEQQMKQYELLKSSLDNVMKSEKMRNDFFSRMSHDMRTPLNGIIGYIELGLDEENTLGETREYLRKIKGSTKQLLELISYILEVSRVENTRIDALHTQIDIKECTEKIIAPFYALSKTENRHFTVQYFLSDSVIYAPVFELTQILNNLLSNAFKYTRKNDDILLVIKQMDFNKLSKFQIIVQDSGLGMTKEFLQKIFIPYQREVTFGAKGVIGAGLGMPIVKNIITSLNGEISVESELGKGTKVSVVLPFEVIRDNKPVQTEKKSVIFAGTNKLKGKRILLVEDNQINMEIASKLLDKKGLLVDKAWNGQEAVDAFEKSEPYYYQLILMDMQMPLLDGNEATKKIRAMQREDAAIVPIIGLSANAFAEDIARGLHSGMVDYISKPINVEKFFSTLEKYL